jgi:hypothetical protein
LGFGQVYKDRYFMVWVVRVVYRRFVQLLILQLQHHKEVVQHASW